MQSNKSQISTCWTWNIILLSNYLIRWSWFFDTTVKCLLGLVRRSPVMFLGHIDNTWMFLSMFDSSGCYSLFFISLNICYINNFDFTEDQVIHCTWRIMNSNLIIFLYCCEMNGEPYVGLINIFPGWYINYSPRQQTRPAENTVNIYLISWYTITGLNVPPLTNSTGHFVKGHYISVWNLGWKVKFPTWRTKKFSN